MSSAAEAKVPTSEGQSGTDQALKNLVVGTDLVEIRVTKWHAELLSDEPAEVSNLNLKVESAFRYRDNGFDTRFNVDAPLTSSSGSDVANIAVEVVASFAVEGEDRPTKPLLNEFIDHVAFFVVMPFIREGLQSLSMRIGLEPITLGLLHQGKGSPSTAWHPGRNYGAHAGEGPHGS